MTEAAESLRDVADWRYFREASLAYLTRRTTEAKTQATRRWISEHVKTRRRYRPPGCKNIHPELKKDRKEFVGRYYQLLSSHAAIETYLADMIQKTGSNRCWWCNSAERQPHHHLFRCQAWRAQRDKTWRSVGKACRWKHPRAPSVRALFQNDEATPAVRAFLRKTRVGRMANLGSLVEEGGAWKT